MTKHTPGPWYWEKRESGMIRLYTPKNGSCTVMDFARMGMQRAQPRFNNRGGAPLGGVMIDAVKIDLENHPDARLIAAAPALLEACKAALNLLEIMEYSDGADEGELAIIGNIRAAIDQAEAQDGQ